MIEDGGLRARCGQNARAEVEKRLTDVAIGKRSIDVYQGHLNGKAVATDPSAVRMERVSAKSQRNEADALQQRIAQLEQELAAARSQQGRGLFARLFGR
jgi:uncharacterized protein YceH (UPF0502 family)